LPPKRKIEDERISPDHEGFFHGAMGGGRMSGVTLEEAQRKFASALQDLRQSNVAAFELWLKGAPADASPAGRNAIAGQIASSRRKLASEFVTGRAAAIVETLNAGARAHILRKLAEFATLGELPTMHDAGSPLPAGRWSGALRAAFGAALGGAAALLVLSALAMHGERARPAAGATTRATSQIPAPAPGGDVAAPVPRRDAGAPASPGPAPRADTPAAATQNAKPRPPAPSPDTSELSALMVIIGAFGAAAGAFAAAMPAWVRGGWRQAKRGPLGGIAIAALALGGAGLVGRWLTGPASWWSLLLAVVAALAVWLVRALWPDDAPAPATEHAAAVAALERQLRVDSEIWTAFASGLVLGDKGGDRSAQQLDQVRAVILAHRDGGEAGEEILRVIEQELGLPIGPRDAVAAGAAPAWPDFSWTPRHAGEFETFGIVEPGDLVRVKIPPRTTVENGTTRIVQKGVVVRKS
jgi:hypothetical protein